MSGSGTVQQRANRRCLTSRKGQGRQARLKGCGKSAPQAWQQGWHGKPHRVQDRIGMARSLSGGQRRTCRDHPGWLPEVPGNRHPRGMVIQRLSAWTEPGLQLLWCLIFQTQQGSAVFALPCPSSPVVGCVCSTGETYAFDPARRRRRASRPSPAVIRPIVAGSGTGDGSTVATARELNVKSSITPTPPVAPKRKVKGPEK